MQIFLAFAAVDANVGEQFHQALRTAGADVFVDAEPRETESLRRERGKRLETSDCYIVLLSRGALASGHVRALSALFTASAQGKPGKRVIPVWLQPLALEQIWAPLARLQPISGSTPATFAPEHLIALTLAACDLALPTVAVPALTTDQPTMPRLSRRRSASPRLVLVSAGAAVLALVLVSVLVIHGGAGAGRQSVALAITPGSTSVVRLGTTLTPAPSATPLPTGTSAKPTAAPTATNGAVSAPTATSIVATATAGATVTAAATVPAPTATRPSATATATATPVPPTPVPAPLVDFTSGFATAGALQLNGSASVNGTVLRLTDGNGGEAGSAFTTAPVAISHFSSSFQFLMTNATADGIAFVVQAGGATALGVSGGSLGYAGINNSIAIKFDNYTPVGNSTGLYLNGASPDQPETALPDGIDLHSGHPMKVTIAYATTTLTVTITDEATGTSASQSYSIDIAGTIGGAQAYVGFTGATGGLTAIQDIQNWVMRG